MVPVMRPIFDFMNTSSKTFLALSITGFAGGSIIDFTGYNVNPSWTVMLPLGAVFFGLFMISLIMEKEAAKFDEEESAKHSRPGQSMTAPAANQPIAAGPSIHFQMNRASPVRPLHDNCD
jgi:hypothetical protein